ncbi:MAG TPA: hypothetical protein VG206_11575 [Terriglobia bacterium]|nr:hypothetical protein [Terriglobia bacterium]
MLACILNTAGLAQDRPNFSGSWVLNKTKSKQRDPRQFTRQTMEVSQRDPDLKIQIRDQEPDGHEFRAYLDLKTNGDPAVAILGAPQTAVVRWADRKMLIRWNLDGTASNKDVGPSGRQGATPPFTWTWTLSPDRKVLVNQTHLYGDVTGDIEERLVYDRKH